MECVLLILSNEKYPLVNPTQYYVNLILDWETSKLRCYLWDLIKSSDALLAPIYTYAFCK